MHGGIFRFDWDSLWVGDFTFSLLMKSQQFEVAVGSTDSRERFGRNYFHQILKTTKHCNPIAAETSTECSITLPVTNRIAIYRPTRRDELIKINLVPTTHGPAVATAGQIERKEH